MSDPDPVPWTPRSPKSVVTDVLDNLAACQTRWMISDEVFDADKLIEFLQGLIKDAGKKVFLILDNLRVHHSKLVKAWVAEHKEELELFYLPSYSPQLNPEERLNADLKQEMDKRVPVRTKAKLREADAHPIPRKPGAGTSAQSAGALQKPPARLRVPDVACRGATHPDRRWQGVPRLVSLAGGTRDAHQRADQSTASLIRIMKALGACIFAVPASVRREFRR